MQTKSVTLIIFSALVGLMLFSSLIAKQTGQQFEQMQNQQAQAFNSMREQMRLR